MDGLRHPKKLAIPGSHLKCGRKKVRFVIGCEFVVKRYEVPGPAKFWDPVVVNVEHVEARIFGGEKRSHLVMDRVPRNELYLDLDAGLLLKLRRESVLHHRPPGRRQKDRPNGDTFSRRVAQRRKPSKADNESK